MGKDGDANATRVADITDVHSLATKARHGLEQFRDKKNMSIRYIAVVGALQ